jgi:oligopeptide transport system substrate-binding protein
VSGRFFACAVVVLSLASACSGGGNKAVRGNPKAGGRIVVAAGTPSSLDPSKGSKRGDLYFLKQICDTLVSFDPVTGALKPGTAQSWTIAPDAKKVTFKLRPGVKFQNGRDVTSQDYVYSLSRFVNQQTGSQSYFILDKIVGYRDVLDGRSDTLSGVHATDPLTLDIDLIEPFAELPAVLAHPAAGAAIPKEEVDKDPAAFAQKPVCTGPYMLDKPWGPGQDIDLVRSKSYYKANKAYSRGGAGYADEILVRTLPDTGPDAPDVATGYAWLVDGKADIADVPLARLSGAKRLREHNLAEGPTGSFEYVGFPTKKTPLDNATFRRALGLAIDRKDLVDGLLDGTRVIPGGLLPPAAGTASKASACSAIKPQADKKAAQSAMRSSGVSPAATLLTVFYNDGGSGHDRWLRRVTGSWESVIRIRSQLKAMPRDEYFKYLNNPGADGPFRSGWPVSFPSAESVYGPLLGPNSGDNFAKYESPEFDAAIKAARSATDDKARADAYAKVGEVLCRDLPITPMWFDESHISFTDRIQSATSSLLDIYGDPVLRELGNRR